MHCKKAFRQCVQHLITGNAAAQHYKPLLVIRRPFTRGAGNRCSSNWTVKPPAPKYSSMASLEKLNFDNLAVSIKV